MKEFFEKTLSLNRSMLGILLTAILLGLGEKMAERFIPLMLVTLGAAQSMPGIMNALDNILSALYSLPGGYLTQKWGYKRALAFFNGIAILGFALVIIFPMWQVIFLGSFLFISWTSLSLPAIMDAIHTVVPKNKGVLGVSWHSLARRVPMALGPILGGYCMDHWGIVQGGRIAFACALVLAFAALGFQMLFLQDKPKAFDANKPSFIAQLQSLKLMPLSLRILLVSDILVRICEQLPYAYLALWVLSRGAGLTQADFGYLTAIEMLVALLIYIPVAWLADRGSKKWIVTLTFFNFAIFPLVLWQATSWIGFVLAFIVRGLKEFGEPTRKNLIMELSPQDSQAFLFGAYYFLRDSIVGICALASGFLWEYSPAFLFVLASVFGFAGMLIFGLWGKEA